MLKLRVLSRLAACSHREKEDLKYTLLNSSLFFFFLGYEGNRKIKYYYSLFLCGENVTRASDYPMVLHNSVSNILSEVVLKTIPVTTHKGNSVFTLILGPRHSSSG
jgi:hypothetical protein